MDERLSYRNTTKYSSPRRAREDASRDDDTQRIVHRLLELNATHPQRARALQDLSPGEKRALEYLSSTGLAQEVGKDLWWLHPMAWDDSLDASLRKQIWMLVVVFLVCIPLIWLQYCS